MKFQGSIVALVTPFNQGKVDCKSLQGLVEWHCQSGTEGIVICGSTGEGNLVTPLEREQIIKSSLEAVRDVNHTPIIVGCGSSSTQEAIQMAIQAEKLGAQGILVVSPYYVKPSQVGLYHHFDAIHKACGLPIIIYNNPGRSGVDQSLDLICQLAELPRIIALKDSSSDLSRPTILRNRLGDGLSLLAGDDPITAAYLAQGGEGMISVTANIVPSLSRQLIASWKKQDIEKFNTINQNLMVLNVALGVETNPCPIKYALSAMGRIQNELRLPLLSILPENRIKIDEVLRKMEII